MFWKYHRQKTILMEVKCGMFYKENNVDRIIRYCEKDTIAVAQIILRLRNEELLVNDEILSV